MLKKIIIKCVCVSVYNTTIYEYGVFNFTQINNHIFDIFLHLHHLNEYCVCVIFKKKNKMRVIGIFKINFYESTIHFGRVHTTHLIFPYTGEPRESLFCFFRFCEIRWQHMVVVVLVSVVLFFCITPYTIFLF